MSKPNDECFEPSFIYEGDSVARNVRPLNEELWIEISTGRKLSRNRAPALFAKEYN